MTTHASNHLARAKSRLEAASAEDVVIAALFIRMAMEAIIYKTLEGYARSIPNLVIKTWQPPQAFRALLQFEPKADQDFTISIAEGVVEDFSKVDEVVWHDIAKHKAFTSKWLNRHYHKVGSLLHVPQGSEQEFATKSDDIAYLNVVLKELEEALRHQVIGSPFPIIVFNCSVCGSTVGRNEAEFRAGKPAVCLQNDCGAEFLAVNPVGPAGTQIEIELSQVQPPCSACRQPMLVRPKKLGIGAELVCAACGRVHLVRGHNWIYAAK